LKAIVNLQGSLAGKQRLFYLDGEKGPQARSNRGFLMTRADKALVLLLRIVGVPALFALVAVVMPTTSMAATHRWLGLGEMPTAPVVEYLARSVSAFYALFGALCLVVAL
jgi:hypothetical protein